MNKFYKLIDFKLFNKIPIFSLTIVEVDSRPTENAYEMIESQLNEEEKEN